MTDTISIRLTIQDREAVEAAAALAGVTVSEFCRRHRRRWEAGKIVTMCENMQNVTAGPMDAMLRVSGIAPADDLMEWRAALVRDARRILARHRPPQVAEVEGVDYIVEGCQ